MIDNSIEEPKKNAESTETQSHDRPGYSYATTLDKTSDQFVRVKLEIKGQVKIVAVCALCHKAFRLCSLDPSVTEEEIASAKYIGLADGSDGSSGGGAGGGASNESKNKADSKTDTKDSKDPNAKDLDAKSGSDLGKKSASEKSASDSDKKSSKDDDKKSGKSEDEDKKKKKSHHSSDRNKTLPETSWTTHKPSHEEWNKKKKKDY